MIRYLLLLIPVALLAQNGQSTLLWLNGVPPGGVGATCVSREYAFLTSAGPVTCVGVPPTWQLTGPSVAPVTVTFNTATTSCAPGCTATASPAAIVVTHNLGTVDPFATFYDSSGKAGAGAAFGVPSVQVNSANVATYTFSVPANGTGSISTGGVGPMGPTGPAGLVNYVVYPETFGAVGDGTTDDTTAIQAAINSAGVGGTVQFGPKTYAISSVLTVSSSGENLVGIAQHVSGTAVSILKSTATTGDMIKFNGGGAGNCVDNSGIWFASVKRLSLIRATAATAGKGINITHGCGVKVEDVFLADNFSQIYQDSSSHTLLDRVYISFNTSSASVRSAVEVDSSVGSSNNSSNYIRQVVINGTGSNIIGLNAHGSAINDLFVNWFETATVDYGVKLVVAGCSTFTCDENVHLNGVIADQTHVAGIFVSGFTGGTRPSVSILDYYFQSSDSGAIGVDIESSNNVSINHGLFSSTTAGVGVKINASSRSTVTDCSFTQTATGVTLLASSSYNNITNNLFSSQVGAPATTYVNVGAGGNLNVITGNRFVDYATNGVVIASTALANQAWPNSMDNTHITNGYVNNGGFGNVTSGLGGGNTSVSGCSATVGTNSTNMAGFVTSGTSGACNLTLTFDKSVQGLPTTGWACNMQNITHTGATNQMFFSATGTATVQFTGTTVTADVLYYQCTPF